MQTSKNITIEPSFSGIWLVRKANEIKRQDGMVKKKRKRRSRRKKQQEKQISSTTVSTVSSNSTTASAQVSLSTRLSDWLILIPDYDGCPYKLVSFIESVRYVKSKLDPEHQRTLLLGLATKLRSKAKDLFGHKMQRYSNIDDFFRTLSLYFGDRGAEAELLDELYRVRQCNGEPLDAYGARVEKLVSRLCLVYREDALSDVGAKRENERLVGEIALVNFRRGLRNAELEVRLKSCDLKSLEEAIEVAIVFERQLETRDKTLKRARELGDFGCGKKRKY